MPPHDTTWLLVFAAVLFVAGVGLSLAGRTSLIALIIEVNSRLPAKQRFPLLGWNPMTWLRFIREMKALKADAAVQAINRRYLLAAIGGAVLMTAGVLLAVWLLVGPSS